MEFLAGYIFGFASACFIAAAAFYARAKKMEEDFMENAAIHEHVDGERYAVVRLV